MPPFARYLSTMAILLAAGWQASFADDRYADRYVRYNEAEPQALDAEPINPPAVNSPSVDSQPVVEAAPSEEYSPAAAPEGWTSPAWPTRQLPIRFEKRDPTRTRSRVVQASAVESVESELSPASSSKPRLLKPEQASSAPKRSATGPLPSIPTLVGSVAIVVGLFLIVAWLTKRGMPKQAPLLPHDALEVLGRQRFGGKQELQLVRLGNKLVLIHVTPSHVESIAEVTDPEEVDRLTGLCYQNKPHSSSRGFQQTLDQFAKDKPTKRAAGRSVIDKLDISMFEGLGRSSSKTA